MVSRKIKKRNIRKKTGLLPIIERDIRTDVLQTMASQGSGLPEKSPSVGQGTGIVVEVVQWLLNDMERDSASARDGAIRVLGCQVTSR